MENSNDIKQFYKIVKTAQNKTNNLSQFTYNKEFSCVCVEENFFDTIPKKTIKKSSKAYLKKVDPSTDWIPKKKNFIKTRSKSRSRAQSRSRSRSPSSFGKSKNTELDYEARVCILCVDYVLREINALPKDLFNYKTKESEKEAAQLLKKWVKVEDDEIRLDISHKSLDVVISCLGILQLSMGYIIPDDIAGKFLELENVMINGVLDVDKLSVIQTLMFQINRPDRLVMMKLIEMSHQVDLRVDHNPVPVTNWLSKWLFSEEMGSLYNITRLLITLNQNSFLLPSELHSQIQQTVTPKFKRKSNFLGFNTPKKENKESVTLKSCTPLNSPIKTNVVKTNDSFASTDLTKSKKRRSWNIFNFGKSKQQKL